MSRDLTIVSETELTSREKGAVLTTPPGSLRSRSSVESRFYSDPFEYRSHTDKGNRTRQDVVMPLSQPIRGINGQMMSEVPLSKGTTVVIGIRACNRNAALWGDDAREWKPERWLGNLPGSITDARVPGVYSNL